MNRSTSAKILTTHVGSLPQPDGSWTNAASDREALRRSVEDVVRKQREAGLDVVNDGEYAKGGDWLSLPTIASQASNRANRKGRR